MNKEVVKGIVSNKLKDITFKENADLLIGKHVFNQLSLGTYFVDYGNYDFPSDIRDYQEKYISSEYFKTPGYLQWNYYLIFLREKYDEEAKQRIEKDGVYTRKFVFTPDEFNDYFDYQRSEQAVDSDIISEWKEKLRQVDLDEVFSDTHYAQAIPRFLANKVIKDTVIDINEIETGQRLTIDKISSIKLNETYRKYPLKREFALGKVNLVTGVNGSGKTSFLESIELMIAGKSNRDPFFNEEYGCIEALYNERTFDSYTPGDNTKYRERDKAWYSSAYKSGNELFRAFNKYNFYDSDAAYSLSHNSNIKDLTSYISSIALGAEFNRIQDRLWGFKERLAKELRIRDKEIREEKDRIKLSNDTLQNIKLTSIPEENYQAFLSHSKQIKWKKELPKTHNDSFSGFTNDYQTIQSLINSLNQLLATLKIQNLQLIQIDILKIENALKNCKKRKDEIEKLNETLSKKRKDLEVVGRKFQTLESAKKFYNDQSSFNLWKLNDRIDELSVKIKRETRALDHFEKVTNQKILQENNQFESFKRELFENLQELKEKRKELNGQIENLKANLDNLQQVVTEIKSYGKQFLSLKNDADSCPLCETTYSFEELSTRISKIAKSVGENVAIDKLNNQLIQLNNELVKVEEAFANVQHIESGILIISGNEYSKLSLLEIGREFITAKSNLKKNTEAYSKLLRLREGLEDKGLYEDDFNHVKKEIESVISDIKFEYEDMAKFQAQFTRIENEKTTLLEEINNAEETSIEISDSIRKILEKVAPGLNFSEYESELTFRIELLRKAVDYFNVLRNYLDYPDSEDITDISHKSDKLFKLYENLNLSLSSQKELKLANQIISKSEKKLEVLERECKRITEGLMVIDDILENHGESKILGDFMKNNENEIQEIFQNIHSPKEFSHITFSESQNTVLLKRRKDNVEVPINKISTGQRSALALSIFLALNKKLKYGPNLILFDDPVTYTDDLNILSFLDYLREIVIHDDRQLVFATANQKLSGLFEKKFMFLGDNEFRKFEFER
jgi:exonuclease SbcC